MSDNTNKTSDVFDIVERMSYKDNDGHALYKGICKNCGFERIARLSDLQYPKVCTHIRVDGGFVLKRGSWKSQRLRCIFDGMKKRCYDESVESYRWYGAKGIKVCDEWMDDPSKFEEWALANGYKDELTIDRIEEDKDYCPENCRWITKIHNSKYKSTTSMINVNGVIHSGKDWARILGIGLNTINKYVRKYGLNNTISFIEKFLENPISKSDLTPPQSYYSFYIK